MNTPVNQRSIPANPGYPLVTKERTQKLELLNHLIDNLAHTIVVCGPEGIGKTRLLKIFQQSSAQSCMICWLEGSNKLNYAEVLEGIFKVIGEYLPDLKTQPLSTALDRINSRGAKVILVADDAGELMPGLVEKIIGYANAHPALRVVLALTHGELYLKSSTDPALEDCYLVEIPALSEQQCEDYLDYLSTLPRPRIDFSQINEEKVAQVFRESHGVPGKILALLPQSVVKKSVDYSKPILMVAVAGLVLLALGVQWWSTQHLPVKDDVIQAEAKNKAVVNQKSPADLSASAAGNIALLTNGQSVQTASPVPLQPQASSIGNDLSPDKAGTNPQGLAEQPNASIVTPSGNIPPQSSPNGIVNNAQQPQQTQEISQNNAESGGNVSEGGHWLAAQPSVNYTLQLMAMSNEQVIIEVLQRYPELGDDLRYIKTKTRRGRDRFILFYGSFSDPLVIKAEKQKLPKELQKIWVRQIADLQKELNATEQLQPRTD